MTDDPAKQAWQASVEIAGAPPLEEVRAGADKLYRRIWWRNAIEYAACAVVIVVFSTYIVTLPHVLQKIGSALVVLTTIYVARQLHRRASAVSPEQAGAMPIYAFLRTQLVRQRDAVKGILWWYILPFLPGLILIVIGRMLSLPDGPDWRQWSALAAMLAILTTIWWLNQFGARALQRHIDDIDALIGGNE